MDLPNITIDDINFRLEGYNQANQVVDRAALKVISTMTDGRTFELYLYQSETSLGFWRLGCFNRGQLYKGNNDYVQQTSIHFTLQEFINKNISRVREIRFENTHLELNELQKERISRDCPEIFQSNFPLCYNKLSIFKQTMDHYIPRNIDDPTRIVEIRPFIDFNKDEWKRCGNWKEPPELYLDKLSEEFSEHYLLDRDSITFLYNDIYRYNNKNTDGSMVKLNIIYNIFVCNLTPRKDGPVLYLYFTIYNIIDGIKVKEESLLVDRHYFPLFLTTNTKITPYGTFENYVLSAGYICKLFEYKKQSETFGRSISGEHQYIGYIYNDLFPFNQIKI
jgi:hypothetical protein